jgi:hypothetical protein
MSTNLRFRVIGVLVVGALTAWGLLRVWQLGFEARRLLESLGLPPGAYDISDIDVQGPDGPMPEIATRSFRVRSDAQALERFYFGRCKQAGLSEPRPESARLEAQLLCERARTGGLDWVLLSTRCERDGCLATLEVHR